MKDYGNDRDFLLKYLKITELSRDNKKILLTPSLQGRVMTSTCGGDNGYSFGWLNYNLISSGKILPHCNNYGGEDRFWLGPEGGQYSWFFKKGTDFGFEDWQTPPVIDIEPWEQVSCDGNRAVFRKTAGLENCSGIKFSLSLDRTVSLLSDDETESVLGCKTPPGVSFVAFRSDNRITNNGDFEWKRETGMPSIWILGQFKPSEDNTIMIPFKDKGGEQINDAYFGKIPEDRLSAKNNILYFKGDGKRRGKIGIPPGMTVPVCGAFDRTNGTFTVVKFSFGNPAAEYVNSMWEHQKEPFKGDVINSYNDGPLEDGSVMGPFYELETSSPAANLKPGESMMHSHTTMHFSGAEAGLEKLIEHLFRTDK